MIDFPKTSRKLRNSVDRIASLGCWLPENLGSAAKWTSALATLGVVRQSGNNTEK
jgi:hypothetical protein